VAVIREEGSNGDREMAAAVYAAGMEPWDITMSDLLAGRASLDSFRGIVFVGGFSYADVLDSAKGWAGEGQGSEGRASKGGLGGGGALTAVGCACCTWVIIPVAVVLCFTGSPARVRGRGQGRVAGGHLQGSRRGLRCMLVVCGRCPEHL
jgi:hypothetical protein